MQLSSYQSLVQLYLVTFLRTLFARVLQLVWLVRTTTSTPPIARRRVELEIDAPFNLESPYNHDRHLDPQTSAFLRKPVIHLPRAFYEGIVAIFNGPLPLSPGEDQSEGPNSIRRVDGATSRTRPSLDLTPFEDGAPTVQHVHALLALLIHFHLYSTPPRHNAGIVVPTPIARRLIRVPRWLGIAPVLAEAYFGLRNVEREGDGPFTAKSTASNLEKETPNRLPQQLSTQSQTSKPVSRTPNVGALYETYFIPANPSLLGRVEEPKGSPVCAGGYSDVWRCSVRFSTQSEGLPAEVAVKVLRSVWLSNRNEADAAERMLRRFMQEIITWLGLPKHPNIVPLIGWTLTPNLAFISPWYGQGNLYRHLNGLSDARRIQIALGIAKGLECLHSRNPPVIHGDLKPENILLSDCGEPLLADFGLSTIVGEERMYTSSHRVGGSFPWMSPEQMTEGSRSCQSDVYSFGSLAFTVMTGELPHAGLTDGQITLKVCDIKDPKDPVEDWNKYPLLPAPVKDLLRDCWSRSPDARPSASAIVHRLTVLLEPKGLT
ncbi:copper transport protein ctr1 [Tulasnella sp. UAMH 9824]|nr:copper transport protein ctr1 [Tulasnella sp. UAMH 9824]